METSIQILISLLKQNGVKKLVLSSGMRNVPFIRAVEVDPDFECYSVVDERGAAFFALGLCQQSGEPAALACTSGTAASNYLSGVTEAYYSHAPLVVITFDRSPYALEQIETQKIDQLSIFNGACKKSVSLPMIKDNDDAWYCQRLVNEAFIAMFRRQPGPVQINVPLVGGTNNLWQEHTPSGYRANRIDYLPIEKRERWEPYWEKLLRSKKVLIVMGQSLPASEVLAEGLRAFCHQLRVPLLADHLANFQCDELVESEAVIKALNQETIQEILPEIVISFGANFQERTKELLRAGKFEHWSIDPEGIVRDVFKSQTALFDCTPEEFFVYFTARSKEAVRREDGYLRKWKRLEASIVLPEMPFTNFYVTQELSKVIPPESILHLSILNATRQMLFFPLDPSITVYSNVNAFGIDGCLPTFMGQAAATDRLAFLLIGDLSFFYGMNALGIRHRGGNLRILLVNNGGGAEFHIPPDSNASPTVDLHIGAAHDQTAKGWAESLGYRYLSAKDEESLREVLPAFVSQERERPILLEVFTNMKQDGEFCLSVYRAAEVCVKRELEAISRDC